MQNNIEMPFTRGGIVHLLILFTEKYAFLSGCGSQGEGIDLPWGRNKWKTVTLEARSTCRYSGYRLQVGEKKWSCWESLGYELGKVIYSFQLCSL